MDDYKYILAVNPGSTSTKIALFRGFELYKSINLQHNVDEIKGFNTIYDQKDMRINIILQWLRQQNINLEDLEAVVGRGGLLRPMPGGTYTITEKMLEDLRIGFQAQHASNLGGIIAHFISEKAGVPSFIVDPVAVDEFEDVARISGMPEIPRRSLVHALNIKAVTRRVCRKINKAFEEASFVVAHLGGGISIVPVKNGRIIDANNANEEGPFSPERCGSLPVGDVVRMCYSRKYSYAQMKKKVVGEGGITAYLGTNDGREVMRRIQNGDKYAELIFKAMAYQIAKEIGAMSTPLMGQVDRIIITGGLAHNASLVEWIKEKVEFIAPLEVVPGEDEMLALWEGAYRVLRGYETAKNYDKETF